MSLGVVAWSTGFGTPLESVVIAFVSICLAWLLGMAIPALGLEDEADNGSEYGSES
jgi:hypothetical protein